MDNHETHWTQDTEHWTIKTQATLNTVDNHETQATLDSRYRTVDNHETHNIGLRYRTTIMRHTQDTEQWTIMRHRQHWWTIMRHIGLNIGLKIQNSGQS